MLKILVVEDHPLILDSISEVLEKQGYAIFKTPTGAEAISIVQQQRPEIIILDLLLKDMSGLKVLREAKAANPKTFVIVITGFIKEDLKQKAYQMGADYFFYKPVPLKTLRDHVINVAKSITEKSQWYFLKGYTVISAQTGQDALSIYPKENPDIVLLELGLPDIDGREILKTMQ